MKYLIAVVVFCWSSTSSISLFAAETPPENPGRRIFIDPATGQRTAPPAAPAVSPALSNRVSTATEGLKEVPVSAKPGGVKVHLGGRFQATVTATNSGSGKPLLQCLSETNQPVAQQAITPPVSSDSVGTRTKKTQ